MKKIFLMLMAVPFGLSANVLFVDFSDWEQSIIPSWVTETTDFRTGSTSSGEPESIFSTTGWQLATDDELSFSITGASLPQRMKLSVSGTNVNTSLSCSFYGTEPEALFFISIQPGTPQTIDLTNVSPIVSFSITPDAITPETAGTISAFSLVFVDENGVAASLLTALTARVSDDPLISLQPFVHEEISYASMLSPTAIAPTVVRPPDLPPVGIEPQVSLPTNMYTLVSDGSSIPLLPSSELAAPSKVALRSDAVFPFSSQHHAIIATSPALQKVSTLGLPFTSSLSVTNWQGAMLLGQPQALDLTGGSSISLWVKPSNIMGGARKILCRGYRHTPDREIFLGFTNGDFRFGIWHGGSGATVSVPYSYPLNEWVHITGVYQSSNNTYVLYFNGIEVGRHVSQLAPTVFDAPWSIGNHHATKTRVFRGEIGNITFWKSSLTPESCAALYQAGLNEIPEGSLIHLWKKTWTLTLFTGETQTLSQVIAQVDTSAPLFTRPNDKLLVLSNQVPSVENCGNVVLQDQSGRVEVTYFDAEPKRIVTSSRMIIYTMQRTWLAEDNAGNETTAIQEIIFVDTTPPLLAYPADCVVDQTEGISPSVTGVASATDNSNIAPSLIHEDISDTGLSVGIASHMSGAVECDTIIQGVDEHPSDIIDISQPFSLLAKVVPVAGRDFQSIISKGYTQNPSRGIVFHIHDDHYQFGYWDGNNHFASVPVLPSDYSSTISLVGVFTGNEFQLYKNGILAASISSIAPTNFNSPWFLGYSHVGSQTSSPSRHFQGQIIEAAISSNALTATEAQHFNVHGLTAVPYGMTTFKHPVNTASPFTLSAYIRPLDIAWCREEKRRYETEIENYITTAYADPFAPDPQEALVREYEDFLVRYPFLETPSLLDVSQTILGKGYTVNPYQQIVFNLRDNRYLFGYWNGQNHLASIPVDPEDRKNGIVLTGVFTGTHFKLYKNGKCVATHKPIVPIKNFDYPWFVGSSHLEEVSAPAKRIFWGDISDVAIWRRALSERECAVLAHRTAFPVLLMHPSSKEDQRIVIRKWTAEDTMENQTIDLQTITILNAYQDYDADSLCAYLEMEYDSSDTNIDTDGDTLDDFTEVFKTGTHPYSSDTDNDKLPDDWELKYGFSAVALADTYQDPDNDGLPNISEYLAGTDPLNPDTDGDGLSDSVEVLSAHSDPLVADVDASNPTLVGDIISGTSATGKTGAWGIDGTSIYARERSGIVTYTLTVPTPSPHVLAVNIEQNNKLTDQALFELSLKIDNIFIARLTTTAERENPKDVLFFLPVLEPGEHTFQILWHNWSTNTFLKINNLRFLNFGGPDADGNGIPDWQDARRADVTNIDALPQTSLTSPLCVEGSDLWRDVLDVEVTYPVNDLGETPTSLFRVIETIGEGFYVNVPLDESGEAVTISLDNRQQLSHAFPVVWEPLNVFDEEFAETPLMIRENDALRLGGSASGNATLTIYKLASDETWIKVVRPDDIPVMPITQPFVFEFDTAGRYLVEATTGSGETEQTAYAHIDVVQSAFPHSNPALLRNRIRQWECPNLSSEMVLEYDAAMDIKATALDPQGLTLALKAGLDRNHGLVSRLGEIGPVIDATQVRPVFADNGSYYRVLQSYADGSQLTEIVLQMGELPEGIEIHIEIFVAGVSFEDGTRSKILTTHDFDELGVCRLRFLRASNVYTSVCHRTWVYQNGQLLDTYLIQEEL